MIHLYKKYHVMYYCIGITLLACMVVSMIMLMLHTSYWFVPFLVFFPTLFLVIANAVVFTRLTSKKLDNEVLILLSNCQANKYLSELQSLFKGKTNNGVIISIYNSLLAIGYVAIEDYDSVCDCCQKIKSRNYQFAKRQCMIDYYISKDLIDQAQNEIEELRKAIAKMKNPKHIETSEIFIKNAEYSIRIKQGNYEGAEEHYLKMLDTIKPLYPLTKASYSYSLGKLLMLKGEPERAKEYLQVAYDAGGDTKYNKHAGEQLQKLTQDS